jgi:hypothetical protein
MSGNLATRAALLLLVTIVAAASVVAQSNKFALVIGIKGYPDFPNPLQFADKDAEAFADFIQTESGGRVPRANIRLLLNSNAKRVDIFRELRWLAQNVRGDDEVYIFFAGHGAMDENNQVFFMPYEGHHAIPEAAGIRADQFVEAVRGKIRPKQLVIFIDACHAAAAMAPGGARAGDESKVAAEFKRQLEAAPELRMLFLSAASHQLSWEDPAKEHGLFTWYLLEGLKGEADRTIAGNRDGIVSAGEVFRYLQERVPMASRAIYKAEQTPIVSEGFVATFPLSRPGIYGGTDPPRERGNTIQDALDGFREGHEKMSVSLLLSVFPNFRSTKQLKHQFDDLQGIAMAMGQPVIKQTSETTAIATCSPYSVTYTTKSGKRDQSSPRRAEFKMRKDGLKWVIDSVDFK